MGASRMAGRGFEASGDVSCSWKLRTPRRVTCRRISAIRSRNFEYLFYYITIIMRVVKSLMRALKPICVACVVSDASSHR